MLRRKSHEPSGTGNKAALDEDEVPRSYRWNSLLKRTIKARSLSFSWASVPAPALLERDGVPQAPGTRYMIKVPEIEAEMDGPQFAIVLAVVRKVLLAPPPRQRASKDSSENVKEQGKEYEKATTSAGTPVHRRGGSSFGSTRAGSSGYFSSGWLRGLRTGGTMAKPSGLFASPTKDVEVANDDNAVDGGNRGGKADSRGGFDNKRDGSADAMASLSARKQAREDVPGDTTTRGLPPVPRRHALKHLVRSAMEEREAYGLKSMAMEIDAKRGNRVVEGKEVEAQKESGTSVQKEIDYTFGIIRLTLRKGSGGGDQLSLVIQSGGGGVSTDGLDASSNSPGSASRSRRAAVVRSRRSDAFLRSVTPRVASEGPTMAAIHSQVEDDECGVKGKHVFYRDGSGEIQFELSSMAVENLKPGAAATFFEDSTVVLRPVSWQGGRRRRSLLY